MKNNTIEILQKLISIPSWVGEGCDEKEIGDFIYKFLKSNSNLTIYKQRLTDRRFNIIAQNTPNPDILVIGHIDTVRPSKDWTKNPFKPSLSGEKLSGLGVSDMLAGIAIMMHLACSKNLKDNIMFLFYCDEEYDFLGMKRFVKRMKGKINPKLIISLDGEGLQIANSCRGLVELKIKVSGVAGHAANPKSGINAITESMKIITKLKDLLAKYSSKELGKSTLNIAYINGGGSQGNIIAESCEYIVEIRIANENLNALIVKEFIKSESKKLDLKVTSVITRHNLGSWITKKEDLINYINYAPSKKIKSAKKTGYIDIQLLWKVFKKVPTLSFGVGEIGQSHKSDEFVKISNVLKAQKFFKKILTK